MYICDDDDDDYSVGVRSPLETLSLVILERYFGRTLQLLLLLRPSSVIEIFFF